MTDCLVVIPARMRSTRFPGKVLAALGGRPVVEWCWRAAVRARVGPVAVAADHPEVARRMRAVGAEVVLTSPRAASGSDRVWEVARRLRWRACRIVVNLQGDEPLISPGTIRRVVEFLRRRPWADLATAVVPLQGPRGAADPGVVKVARASDGRCLYFSRSPIPHGTNGRRSTLLRHIGIYAYRTPALRRFVGLPPSPLERLERLEQLRALEAGMSIAAVLVRDEAVAIDVPADLLRAERVLRNTRGAT